MPEKKHIAMYIGSLNKGGAERVMCNLAEYFYGEGYHVTLVTTYLADDEYDVPDGKWRVAADGEEDALKDGERIVTALNLADRERKVVLRDDDTPGIDRVFSALLPGERKDRLTNFVRRLDKLRNVWKSLKPDIILSFLGKNNCMAIQSARGLGIPVVVSVRSNPSREYGSKGLSASMNLLFPKAAGVVVQTTGAASYFKKSIRSKCRVLPNSIHPDFMDKKIVPYTERSKSIVTVGRLDANKNQILTIRAFARIMKEFPDYSLKVYGDGPSLKEWKKEAEDILKENNEDIGTSPRISFMGSVSGVAGHIAGERIFVLSSKQEGMPNALIEAMSLGLACISTDCPCGGPADLIRNGENGILIPMGSDADMEDALTDALRDLIRDEERAKELSENAAKVREIYSPDLINRQWKDYVHILNHIL